MNFWMRIFVFIFIVCLVVSFYYILSPHQEELVEIKDDSLEKFLEIKDFITPYDNLVVNLTKTLLGVNYEGNFTETDLTVMQDWIAKNIFYREGDLKVPRTTIVEKFGGHLSLHILEYSMILNEVSINDTKSYILLIDMKYKGDENPQEHSAILSFFGDKVFLSDVTIPVNKLSYICQTTEPEELISDVIQYTYITQYDVKYALSFKEQVRFKDNSDFLNWMKSHT